MSIRLAHLSDIHFGGENAAAAESAAAYVNEGGFDLTVVSGDITRFAEVPEFEAAARWVRSLVGPVLVTPGNHDAPYLAWAERVFAPFRRYEKTFGAAAEQAWAGPGVTVRGLNTARGAQPRLNWSKGQIAPAQVSRAAAAFAAAPAGDLKVLVCHHPLVEMIGGPMTARVWGGEAAAQAFAHAGVDLVLSGHIHAPFAWSYPHHDRRTHAVGAGTLSLRERGVPPSFNVVEAREDCVVVQALAWTGSHYEAYRTWSLDRRQAAPVSLP